MSDLAALAVALPLLVAALLVGLAWLVPRRVVDVAALMTAATVAVFCGLVLKDAADGRIVYWFGGWTPRHGVALGVSFSIDQVGAGLCLFCAVLFVAAFVFAWRYFVVVGPLFHALMLVFLAAMLGFGFTGDLFNLFVFFELVSVSAYALVAYDIEEEGPLQGTLNFAVTNSVGAFFILTGIALLYGRTGALNMAQIGQALAGHDPDGLVIVAFTLTTVGFLVKAAVVPFHFWLADAYSVAPTPVCLLLSAAVSELGLYAVARVYWTVFSGTLGGGQEALQAILVSVGVLTALVGAIMCFGQRHLKRLLAFATVSHVGLFLIGLALLDAVGLAGTLLYVLADGCVKASLFVSVGVLQHLRENVDELKLRGRGRELVFTGPLFAVCGLAAASLPPFGPWWGKSMIESAAEEAGFAWVSPVFVLVSVLTGGAILRAAGRVFAGLGSERDAIAGDVSAPDEADPELAYRHDRVPRTMTAPALGLAALGLLVGVVPGLPEQLAAAAAAFTDRTGYAAAVLHGQAMPAPAAADVHSPGAVDVLTGALTVAGALGLAAVALLRKRVAVPGLPGVEHVAVRVLAGLRALHSGYVGDYVAWLAMGTAVLAGLFALTLSG
jgi:multicomponent Na+:H+ antiporter subunit D